MELTSRMSYVLHSTKDGGVVVDELIRELEISKRTFYYDLEKINQWLSDSKLGFAEIDGKRLIIRSEQWDNIAKKLKKPTDLLLTIEERQALEFLYIALSHETISIKMFEEIFSVSKNTILTDIKELKNKLKDLEIRLMCTIKRGYFVLGDEFSIRKTIWKKMEVLSQNSAQSLVKAMIQQSLVDLTHNEIDFLEISRCVIRQYETDLKTKLVLSETNYEGIMILVAYIRGISGNRIFMDESERATLESTDEFRTVHHIIQIVNANEIKIPNEEIYYVTTLFLGIKRFEFRTSEQEINFISEVSKKLIENFEKIACVRFTDRERLISQISYHIKPMIYRIKYGIRLENPLLKDIKVMYPEVFFFTLKVLQSMGSELNDFMTEDEVAYLCIYIASHLKENANYNPEEDKFNRIMIICGAGMATSVLLKDQLEDLLGTAFHYELSMADVIKEEDVQQCLFVISTAKLKFKSDNIIYSGVILTEFNKASIVRIMRKNAMQIEGLDINDIIQIAKDCSKAEIDETEMYLKLFNMFSHIDKMNISPHTQTVMELRLLNNLDYGAIPFTKIGTNIFLANCEQTTEKIKISFDIINTANTCIYISLRTVDNLSHLPMLSRLYNYVEKDKMLVDVSRSLSSIENLRSSIEQNIKC